MFLLCPLRYRIEQGQFPHQRHSCPRAFQCLPLFFQHVGSGVGRVLAEYGRVGCGWRAIGGTVMVGKFLFCFFRRRIFAVAIVAYLSPLFLPPFIFSKSILIRTDCVEGMNMWNPPWAGSVR